METKIMSGVEFAEAVKMKLKAEVGILKEKGIVPFLTVVQVGNDPASEVYVKQKKKFGAEIGVVVNHKIFPESITTVELIAEVQSSLSTIIVQLPLPNHIDTRKVLDSIPHMIDVDGFTTTNMGRLMSGQHGIQACTPKGIVKLLKFNNIEIEGKHAVIVGRSDIVGKPVAQMMLNENATITICHSKTKNLKEITRQADILIVAIGKPEFISGDYVKEGAVVVDVGIHRLDDGSIVGDVWFDDVVELASAITPVPRGVGRCTVAMLFENVVERYQ